MPIGNDIIKKYNIFSVFEDTSKMLVIIPVKVVYYMLQFFHSNHQ